MPKHGSRHLPSVQCRAKKPVLDLDRQLIDILSIEIVPDVIVATICASGELRHCPESWISRASIRKRRKAAVADRLISVHLRQIRLVYRAGANLRVDASRSSQLVFQAKTPLHEIRCMEFAIRHRRDGDCRQASRRIRLCRCTGKLGLCKARTKRLIGGHGCVNRTVRNSRSNRCAADGSEKATLERFDVGWIETNRIGAAARQNVAENAESSARNYSRLLRQFGWNMAVPGSVCTDSSTRIQDERTSAPFGTATVILVILMVRQKYAPSVVIERHFVEKWQYRDRLLNSVFGWRKTGCSYKSVPTTFCRANSNRQLCLEGPTSTVMGQVMILRR